MNEKPEGRELIPVSVRVDRATLEKLKKKLGLSDNSKAIRAAMNCAVNVTHNLFGDEVQHIFKRRKDNEEVELYDINV